jgi:eukaryotic-like serine/threonine-protein kinase
MALAQTHLLDSWKQSISERRGMALLTGARLGPYEVLELVGAGGMGEVYRARDTRLDRTVALKLLPATLAADPSRRARFDREARAISALSHPHICTLHDIGDQDGQAYLVMEFVEGETLRQRLKRGPLPVAQALEVATQIAEALEAAHRHGIIHRDLKPDNVMLTKTGAKLLDFGLARLTGHGDQPIVEELTAAPTDSAPLTGPGTILGTVPYMAPEQLEGKAADARTDLWALGAIVYEMVMRTSVHWAWRLQERSGTVATRDALDPSDDSRHLPTGHTVRGAELISC